MTRKIEGVYHLLGGHSDGLYAELPAAHIEEVLKVGSKEIDNKDVVQALLAEVVYLRYAS